MKLTLQLVVVVLNDQTMFHDNLLKFTRWHLGRHAPFPPQLFPRNSAVNKHANIVELR